MTFIFNTPSSQPIFVFSVPNVTIGGGTCADATVENSDASYTNTVASGGTLVLDDVQIDVNNSIGNYISSYYPSAVNTTITLPDTDYNIYVNAALVNSFSLPTLKDETININAV